MDVPHFPNDDNGKVLTRMHEGGDDLAKPRVIDFNFIFPERRQALAFAELVDDRDLEVCISYYEGQEMWQAVVKRRMVPTHQGITELEAMLVEHAESAGGEADGWRCFHVN
jgi:hypothetical protein